MLGREVGKQGIEVQVVAWAGVESLEEEDDFRNQRGQSPARTPDRIAKRWLDLGRSGQQPVVARDLVDLDIEVEAGLGRRIEAFGQVAAGGRKAGVDVGRNCQQAAVPGLAGVVVYLGVVGDELPAAEVVEEGGQVSLKYDNINVEVIARFPSQPSVDALATAEAPGRTVAGHQAPDTRDLSGYVVRRMAGGGRGHEIAFQMFGGNHSAFGRFPRPSCRSSAR